jgi:hypothetical protein
VLIVVRPGPLVRASSSPARSKRMPQPDIESPVARTCLGIVTHRVASPIPVVDHAVRRIGTGPLGQRMHVAHRILGSILIQRSFVILADVRGHDGAGRADRDGDADQRVVAAQTRSEHLAVGEWRGIVQWRAVEPFIVAVGKENLDHLEVDIRHEQGIATAVGTGKCGAIVVAMVVRQPGIDRPLGIVDADVVLAAGFAVAGGLAQRVQQSCAEAILYGRRVDERIVRAQIGARDREQVLGAARQAAAEWIAHLTERIVGQRVLASDRQTAGVLAGQPHEGLAVEGLAGRGQRTGVDRDPGLEHEQRRDAGAQFFRSLESQARGGCDAAADFGDVAGCAPAFVDDTGVGDAIDRNIGLRRGCAAGSKQHDDRNRR